MTKRILGLDLGTTSIGYAYVLEDSHPNQSSIQKIGVRVNPLTTDEQTNFEKGKPLTTNADRTLKRGARRNLDRYQLRRTNLIEVLIRSKILSDITPLTEIGKGTTHLTYKLRANAALTRIEKDEFARVLLAINKKRGYKSSRKAKSDEEGQTIDGMAVAKKLYEENLTPGQLVLQIFKEGKKSVPDFYRSDLQAEFDRIWEFQKQFHPEILTDSFYESIRGKGQRATAAAFWNTYKFNTAEIKGKREEKKLQTYKWRSEAFSNQLSKEEVAYILTEINNNINNSSGYLGAISDRSKELYFKRETVGQYLYQQLQENPHTSLTNQVFYRQDYLDEFESIWETQATFHPELTGELKLQIRDIVIFYQRKLKSQKGLVSFCEFENSEIKFEKDGQFVQKTIGLKVAPKSSPLFQEFKIWQVLQNVLIRKKGSRKRSVLRDDYQSNSMEDDKEIFQINQGDKEAIFDEINLKGNIKANKIIELLGLKSSDWELNYSEIEGNRTNQLLYEAYMKILDMEGYDIKNLLKVQIDTDEVRLNDLNVPALQIKEMVKQVFKVLAINTEILDFDAELEGKNYEQQPSYQLWHLLYSSEDDTKKNNEQDILTYGNESIGLKKKLCEKFGFKPEHTKVLANLAFSNDYGNLSSKAMRKIHPYIKENKYSIACELAGYKHSKSSLTKEEILARPLKNQLEILKKNSLRNPVVEKILNQMVHVVNTLIDTENDKLELNGLTRNFQFDEIRIELARELKKNAKERAEMTSNINASKIIYQGISHVLREEFGIKNPTRNDVIRYRLYNELKNNGYKDLYTNEYIPREKLFSKEVDIEHIIPQSKLFDDSFSNKTVVYRKENLAKGNQTAFDYISSRYGEVKLSEFVDRVDALYKLGKEEGITKAKFQKLLKKESEIGDGFIERDLRDSQYIAKKAKQMLFEITRSVVPTSGNVTDRLREDWGLINVMKELNLPKYRSLGLTEIQERKFGNKVEVITDWTKRNDHRHHAMDALTVAFTKHNHIQYLNYLNARKDETHKLHANIIAIEKLETEYKSDDDGNKKRVFKEPLTNFRQLAKVHLENVLVSHKAKNKVVTKNKNKIKTKNSEKVSIELTPRGQLHKETIYGKIMQSVVKEEKIGINFDLEKVQSVTNPSYKALLIKRLFENNNDPKKAFGGKNAPSKSPLYIDEAQTKVMPEKIKTKNLEYNFVIRKDIAPDLKIDKVIDLGVKRVLQKRLIEFNGNAKNAFSDLVKNPIWFNKEKGIAIKRVAITGVSNAEPLHYKKDHFGNKMLDINGKLIPVDYVSTGNNHHVAIYKDETGNLQETVVSMFEAVARVNQGLPIVDKMFNQDLGWQFQFTMKQNEMFVFPNEETGFNPVELELLDPSNKKLISPNLFRVQKLSSKNYVFNNHLETQAVDGDILKSKKELSGIMYHFLQTPSKLRNIVKVRMNHLGDITNIGEY